MSREEDEEMSTIFEIVRLAQERYVSHDTTANRSYTDAEGNLLPTLAGASPTTSSSWGQATSKADPRQQDWILECLAGG